MMQSEISTSKFSKLTNVERNSLVLYCKRRLLFWKSVRNSISAEQKSRFSADAAIRDKARNAIEYYERIISQYER